MYCMLHVNVNYVYSGENETVSTVCYCNVAIIHTKSEFSIDIDQSLKYVQDHLQEGM